MKLLVFDLELSQPQRAIIQLGYIIADSKGGQILLEKSIYVKVDHPISTEITLLTGITDEMCSNGRTLQEAYEEMCRDMKKYGASSLSLAWGCNDHYTLRSQLKLKPEEFVLKGRFIDVKALYQSYQIANGGKTRAGLEAACKTLKLNYFTNTHNALYDALNTWLVFYKLIEKFRFSDRLEKVLK